MAMLFLLRQRNPGMIITFENPKATMVGHPLIQHLFEQPSCEQLCALPHHTTFANH